MIRYQPILLSLMIKNCWFNFSSTPAALLPTLLMYIYQKIFNRFKRDNSSFLSSLRRKYKLTSGRRGWWFQKTFQDSFNLPLIKLNLSKLILLSSASAPYLIKILVLKCFFSIQADFKKIKLFSREHFSFRIDLTYSWGHEIRIELRKIN